MMSAWLNVVAWWARASSTCEDAPGHPGGAQRENQLPCTLVVLDEVQQFTGEDSDRSLQIQEAVEACSKQLNSQKRQ